MYVNSTTLNLFLSCKTIMSTIEVFFSENCLWYYKPVLPTNLLFYCSLRCRQREVREEKAGMKLDMVMKRMPPLLTNQMTNIQKKHLNCQMHLENMWYYFLLLLITYG
jgi:hypothetical protein